MSGRNLEVKVSMPITVPPALADYANVCIANRVGDSVFFDFGFLDPLILAKMEAQGEVTAHRIARIVLPIDQALKLSSELARVLTEKP